jgi:peptidoglycan/LPS O-acetylase OafA/YrhL
MRTKPAEYRALDAYRFLAAAAVVVGHFDDGFRLGLDRLSPLAVRFGLFVDFFFILSGFVIALNYQGRITSAASYGDFIWRRLARLWPLHMVVLAFFGSLGLFGHLVNYQFNYPEAFRLSGLPWNVVLMHAWGPVWHMSYNVASWSISAELFVYLLFPLFAWQARRLPLPVNLGLVVLFVAVMALLRHQAGLLPWYQATYDLGMLRAVPSFLLGVLIHRHIQNSPATSPAGWQFSWPVAHGIFIAALLAMHLNLPAELVIALFGLFVFAAARAEQAVPDTILTRPLFNRLGQASYGLYMVHMPLMTCGIFIIRRTTGYDGGWGIVFAAGTFVLSLALALALYRWLEHPARVRLNAASPFQPQGKTLATVTH